MASSAIRIRSYNVGPGCFLITFPDGDHTRNMLIDFGRSESDKLDADVAENIYRETDGHLDVLVITHEHLDSMGGIYAQRKVFKKFDIDYVWMSYPNRPNYFAKRKSAQPLLDMRTTAVEMLRHVAKAGSVITPEFEQLIRNNIPHEQELALARQLSLDSKVVYLRRGNSVRKKPFSNNVDVTILAPETDISVYYGGDGHRGLAARARRLAVMYGDPIDRRDPWQFPKVLRDKAPPNLSSRDWRLLRESIHDGGVDALLALEETTNNTSLVFLLEVNGKRLLFSGDAQPLSWEHIEWHVPHALHSIDFMSIQEVDKTQNIPVKLFKKLLPKRRKHLSKVVVSGQRKSRKQNDELAEHCTPIINEKVKPYFDVTL